MKPWNVCLLGVSRAESDKGEGRPPVKKVRAVLASLLVPDRLDSAAMTPVALSRQTLADRFWGDSSTGNPRDNLRQAFAKLNQTFGRGCFHAENETICALPGAFVTDIDRIRIAHRKALFASDLEDRLDFLIEAEEEMRGPFLEGCLKEGDGGEPWLLARRAYVHTWLVDILLELADAFEETGNRNGAMDAAQRAVFFQPDSKKAQSQVWRLANETGRETAQSLLKPNDTFEQAVGRLAGGRAGQLTGSNTRFFRALYQAKVGALPLPLQKDLPRLALLPSPFPTPIALDVALVSRPTLLKLKREGLVEQSGERFAVPEAVRTCALRTLPTATRQQIGKRLAEFCKKWMEQTIEQRTLLSLTFPSPFVDHAQAEPFLRGGLHWTIQQSPTHERLHFVSFFFPLGLPEIAHDALSYLDTISMNTAYPALLRNDAAGMAGHILLSKSDFTGAIVRLERALSFVPLLCEDEKDDADEGGRLFLLGNACHYAGDSRAALVHISAAVNYFKQRGRMINVAGFLRFRAEILNHLGDFDEALAVCDEAIALRRAHSASGSALADALFWKASTLYRLDRPTEAGKCAEEALSLWQDTGDNNGIGFCLRLLGRLRAAEGRFAEAGAHIDHAILFHERAGDNGSRLAAVEARADVYFQVGRFSQALPLYEERLADYEARRREQEAEKTRTRIQSCRKATDSAKENLPFSSNPST